MRLLQEVYSPREIYDVVQYHLVYPDSFRDAFHAINFLKDIKAQKKKQIFGRGEVYLYESDLVDLAIAFNSLQLVKYLCLEYYGPEQIIHPNFKHAYLLMAIDRYREDIALFLYSLDCVDDDRLIASDRREWFRKAAQHKLYRLLLTFLKDSTISLLDPCGFYDHAVYDVLCSNNNDLFNALLVRMGPHLNNKVFSDSGSSAGLAFYLFEELLNPPRIEVVEKIIEHPCVDLTTLKDEHIKLFFTQLCWLDHNHALCASAMLRLSHPQRRLALDSWRKAWAVYYQPVPQSDGSRESLSACVVPRHCNSEHSTHFSEEELQRDATPERFGRLAYKLLNYGQNFFGLFLLYQEEFLAGKVDDGWQRLLNIMLGLPLDLQMVMCRRLEGSAKNIYTGKEVSASVEKHLRWYAQYANIQQDVENKKGK
jgi:hypothetical protein